MNMQMKGRELIDDKLRQTIVNRDNILINALPGLGKTRAIAELIPEIEVPITFVTERRELYDQFIRMIDDGVSHEVLPSFHNECPVMNGQSQCGRQGELRDLYRKGLTAREIHEEKHLPCQQGGECPYIKQWNFDPDEKDLLIGHYKQLWNTQKVIYSYDESETVANERRAVVIDEYPGGAYEFHVQSAQQISTFVSGVGDLPQDDITELIQSREDERLKTDTANHLRGVWGDLIYPNPEKISVTRDKEVVLEGSGGTAYGEYAVATIVLGKAKNGFYRLKTDDEVCVYDKKNSNLSVLRPPNLSEAHSVIGLDGTPTEELWRTCLNIDIEEDQVLSNEERRQYLEEEGVSFYQTTNAVKPYSSGENVSRPVDHPTVLAVLEEYGDQGVQPVIISTKKALEELYLKELLDMSGVDIELSEDDHAHYGDLKGSNDFSDRELAVIVGSRHFGDRYVRKWATYADEEVEANGEKGMKKSYGEYGDKILHHMREKEVFQAAMRVGRGDVEADIYLHTAAYPSWLEVEDKTTEYGPIPSSAKKILKELESMDGTFTSSDLEHLDMCKRTIQHHLNSLSEEGVIEQVGKRGNSHLYTRA